MKFRSLTIIVTSLVSNLLLVSPACAAPEADAGNRWRASMDAAALATSERRYEDATRNLENALSEAERFDRDDVRLRSTLSNLASAYEDQQRYQEAAATYKRLFSVPEGTDGQSKGIRHAEIVRLARIEEKLGHLDKAEGLLKHAIDYRRSSADVDSYAFDVSQLGQFYQRHGRYELALAAYDSVLKDLEKDPCEAPSRFEISQDKGRALLEQAELPGTSQEMRAALLVRTEKIGRERLAWLDTPGNARSYELADALYWYASVLRRMQREQDATKLESRADAIEARLQSDHPQEQGLVAIGEKVEDRGCNRN